MRGPNITGMAEEQMMTHATGKAGSFARAGVLAALALAVLLVLAGKAGATENILSYESSISSYPAGGHPDIHTSFELESPGQPEAAKNVVFNAPQGIFGNP